MPKLLITRPLPEAVTQAAAPGFDVTVRAETYAMTDEKMVDALGRFDAILPTLGDPLSANVFEQQPEIKCKVLANFGEVLGAFCTLWPGLLWAVLLEEMQPGYSQIFA